MTLDERLTKAAHGLVDGLNPPEVDLGAVRRQARSNQRRTASLVVTAAVIGVIAAATAIGVGRETSAPQPVGPSPSESVGADPQDADACPLGQYMEEPPAVTTIDPDLQAWVDGLPVGVPPSTPWWHDGVLHARGLEIEAPYRDVEIEAVDGTVLVGGYEDDRRRFGASEWGMLRADRLEPLPVPSRAWPQLSADGRIAWWETHPTPDTTRFVTWDTETNTELASRTLTGNVEQLGATCNLMLVGIDAEGTAYLLDEANDPQITRWDVRNDTVEPTDLSYDRSRTLSDQFDFSWNATQGFEAAYVSPDGTREVFTGPAPGDPSEDCCTTQLRVRPAGPIDSVDPGEITTLELPDGIPSMRLWDGFTDRGTWGVWWETNETLLLDAEVGRHSYLLRCWTTGAGCERVFDLGANRTRKILYMPDWEQDWGFARLPVTE